MYFGGPWLCGSASMFDSWLYLSSQAAQTAEAVKRASRGGMLTGALLAAVGGALVGTARLQQQVAAAARQAGPQAPGSVLWPLVSGLKARSQCLTRRSHQARLPRLAIPLAGCHYVCTGPCLRRRPLVGVIDRDRCTLQACTPAGRAGHGHAPGGRRGHSRGHRRGPPGAGGRE